MIAILCTLVALVGLLILPVALMVRGAMRAIEAFLAPAPVMRQKAVYHIRVAGEHPLPECLAPKQAPKTAHKDIPEIGLFGINDWSNKK